VKQKIPESGVLRACLDLLTAERVWWMRLNVGAVKIGDRFIRFAQSGTADVLATLTRHAEKGEHSCDDECCPSPEIVWVETKSPTGRQSDAQKEFQRTVEAAGHQYMLVRDVDTLRDWLKGKR
jgi:hypothetical protein